MPQLKNTVFLFKKMKKIFFFSSLIFHLSSFAQPGQNKTINIVLSDTIHQDDFNKIKKQLTNQKTLRDTFSCRHELQNILLKLNDNGYLTAGFDSAWFDSLSCHAKLFLGEQYEWLSLSK